MDQLDDRQEDEDIDIEAIAYETFGTPAGETYSTPAAYLGVEEDEEEDDQRQTQTQAEESMEEGMDIDLDDLPLFNDNTDLGPKLAGIVNAAMTDANPPPDSKVPSVAGSRDDQELAEVHMDVKPDEPTASDDKTEDKVGVNLEEDLEKHNEEPSTDPDVAIEIAEDQPFVEDEISGTVESIEPLAVDTEEPATIAEGNITATLDTVEDRSAEQDSNEIPSNADAPPGEHLPSHSEPEAQVDKTVPDFSGLFGSTTTTTVDQSNEPAPIPDVEVEAEDEVGLNVDVDVEPEVEVEQDVFESSMNESGLPIEMDNRSHEPENWNSGSGSRDRNRPEDIVEPKSINNPIDADDGDGTLDDESGTAEVAHGPLVPISATTETDTAKTLPVVAALDDQVAIPHVVDPVILDNHSTPPILVDGSASPIDKTSSVHDKEDDSASEPEAVPRSVSVQIEEPQIPKDTDVEVPSSGTSADETARPSPSEGTDRTGL